MPNLDRHKRKWIDKVTGPQQRNTEVVKLPPAATGYEVLNWPEFKALAERLGINMEKAIRAVKIEAHVDEVCTIDVAYIGRDYNA